MAKIDQLTIDRVLEAADIVDVVGEFQDLRRAGVNYTGLCPFHDDKHAGNFIVRPRGLKNGGNSYRCFVCDKKGGPVQYLMEREKMSFPDAIRWLGRKYNIPVDDVPLNWTPPPPRPVPPPPPPLVIPREWVSGMMRRGYRNNFIDWLYSLPWSPDRRARLSEVLWMYCVAGYNDGRVCFWQIDHEGVPRSAKLMRYENDGHRTKTEHPGWLYNQPGIRERLDPDNHTIFRPLFGSHLLRRYPEARVNIVESEKTAIIMATLWGEPEKNLWLACGGLSWLKLDAMQPLIDDGRRTYLWPDRDGVDAWRQVCDKLGADNVTVTTDFFRTCYVPEDDGPKADVADIALRLMAGGRRPTPKQKPKPVEDAAVPPVVVDDGQPFLDPVEIADPRVRQWREKMGRVHSKGWGQWPTCNVPGVKSVGEILSEHPLLKKLFTNR